jgi:hypothetical protein
MTAKARGRKLRKRLRAEARVVEETKTYSFTTPSKIVEVVAPSLDEAKQKFMFTYGYWPSTPQEYLQP